MTQSHPHAHPAKKWLKTTLKILIAVVGLWYVLSKISWQDHAVIAQGVQIRNVTFTKAAVLPLEAMDNGLYVIEFKNQNISVRLPGGQAFTGLANQNPLNFPDTLELPANYLAQVNGQPEVQTGLVHLVLTANPWLLFAALAILGLPFLITSWRWRKLLIVQDIHLPYSKALTLTFVGQFYSTFLPGTTSGDIVKIMYTGRLTGQKTKSAVTVVLDRVIGLVGMIIVGGTAAAIQLAYDWKQDPAHVVSDDQLLIHVLLLTGGILLAAIIGAVVYFSARLRRMFGLDALIERLPLPEFIKHADRTLRVYRGHLNVIAAALAASIVSQAVLPIAGYLAGRAFGMHAIFGWYMAYIPVAALAASLPFVPPQGIGVLDYILLHFFVTRGVDTASQAFALAQAIRFLPIFWNLIGAWWVVHGKYSRPHIEELDELAPENPANGPSESVTV
ncbi:MAG TPA: lysylphosphatidylglycerol synthase transmembrane domain-containing protein [Phycisphaerae bacterium]|nr:lysylphosphatidylglycerol synthase transmembrane domain-containing protein [Phycisphaerae bacterium]